jgi:putative tricarboxylic transport membrane protein
LISRRQLEVLTALVTGAFGVAILVSSLRIGVGWTGAGVGSGTFPALASFLIVAGSLYNLVRGAMQAGPAMIGPGMGKRIAGLFIPALAFVALIPLLGLHIAAGVYMLYVLWRARLPLWKVVAAAVATPFVLYSVFDWGFQVELLRGLLGQMVGY